MTKSLLEINSLELKAETTEDYLNIISYLEDKYKESPKDVEPVIRLLYIFWIWMLENGSNWMPSLSHELYKEIERKAIKLYSETKDTFYNSPDYQWVIGYIINFAGYYFGVDGDFEKIGINMMKKAYELNPENNLYKLSIMSYELSIEEKISNSEYLELCENSNQLTKTHFENRGCMGEYFQTIFSREDEPTRFREYYEEELIRKQDKAKKEKLQEKKLINPDFAIEIIKSGYSLKNVQVEGKLNFEYLAFDNDVNEQIVIEESIIDEIFSFGLLFKKRVIFINSVFKYITMFQGGHFNSGLEINNCIFENLVDFSCGGHNKDGNEIRIENNTFKKFVNFDDCTYDGPFIMKNNNFEEGTNLLGEWQLSPSFDEVKIIEDNKGELTLVDLPKPYSEYYTRAETLKIEPKIELGIKETIGTVEEGIDSFIKFIETLIPEDKIIIIDEQLNDLKTIYKDLNDKKLKKYIDILEVLKENNKNVE